MGVPAMYYIINMTFILFGLALLVGGIILLEFLRNIDYTPNERSRSGAFTLLMLKNKVVGYIAVAIFAWCSSSATYNSTIEKLYMDDNKVMNICGVEYYKFDIGLSDNELPQIEPRVYSGTELLKTLNCSPELQNRIKSEVPIAKGYAVVIITNTSAYKIFILKELKNFKQAVNSISGTITYKEYNADVHDMHQALLIIIPLDTKEGTVNITTEKL